MFDMYLISTDELHAISITMSFVPSVGTILKIDNTEYRVHKVEVEVEVEVEVGDICGEVITLVLEKI